MEISDYCIGCKYYTNHTEKTFITDWGDEVTLERGMCSYNGNITYPSNHCDINWSEETWAQMHIEEDEDKNGNNKSN